MKLTKEFVEGFLERYDGDLSGPILDIAGSADPVGSLLEYLNRKDIIEWLQYEFDGLLMLAHCLTASPSDLRKMAAQDRYAQGRNSV